jgi:pyrroline-5-carboxylate reductase
MMATAEHNGELARIGRLWVVGCGAMGGAFLGRWLEAGLRPASVVVIDPAPTAPPEGAALVATPAEAAALGAPDAVVLGIKPQQLGTVSEALGPQLPPDPLLFSMLAGVRATTLGHLFPGARIVRVMPNTPARIGRGVTALYAFGATAADIGLADAMARAAGTLVWIDDEHRFDAVTALSGSGPAFLFRFIEAMAGAGEAAGLDAATAATLATATVTGAAALLDASGMSPAQLRQQVTSAKGTTQAGLDILDGDGALSSLLRATVRAATERSRALALAAEALVEGPGHR